MRPTRAALVLGLATSLPALAAAQTNPPPTGGARLQLVAKFDHQVTGVAVAPDGRIFVNFPRWTEDAPVSVAEVGKDGTVHPYPDDAWNSWRNAKKNDMSAGDHFVCVQSVVADGRGNLWVLDPAAPATAQLVPGGPKLVRIDLKTNRVAQTIHFDTNAAPEGSYLNDIRFAPDGRHAYITDSGAVGALVVVDLPSGRARRVLAGDKSTQPEKDVQVTTDGKVLRRPDGRGVEFSADSIALTKDGKYLYWKALTGKTLYRIATDVLDNPSAKNVAARVERVGDAEPTDGTWIDHRGRLLLTAIQDNAVKVREGAQDVTLVQDPRLRWPDTFSEGPDGAIYVTSSHIMDMPWWKPDAPAAVPTELWRIEEGAAKQP